MTVNWGSGILPPGQGPARTGVTVVWAHREDLVDNPVAAGSFALSGTGELTGWNQIQELGLIGTPIVFTNSQTVGLAYDAVWRYLVSRQLKVGKGGSRPIPVVGECSDSFLHDTRGFHDTDEQVYQALNGVRGGSVEEGCVGGGTGMHCFECKGGVGTASRRLPDWQGGWTVGVLLVTNFGRRERLTGAGVPVGEHLLDRPRLPEHGREQGSCIVVVATDAPLDGSQFTRVAKRAAIGLGRTGSTGSSASGELIVAFSTTSRREPAARPLVDRRPTGEEIDPIFAAAIDATEETVWNALCTLRATDGPAGHRLEAIPLDELGQLLAAAGRLDARARRPLCCDPSLWAARRPSRRHLTEPCRKGTRLKLPRTGRAAGGSFRAACRGRTRCIGSLPGA